MIVSWNVRGCNKIAKVKEIRSHLRALNIYVAILIETRVKYEKSKKIRDRLGPNWSYIDNYNHHVNGRIWILWDSAKVAIQPVVSDAQFIHCKLSGIDGTFINWLTAIYAFNHLEDRKRLWDVLETL